MSTESISTTQPTYFVKGKIGDVIKKLKGYFSDVLFWKEGYHFPDFSREPSDEIENKKDIKSLRSVHVLDLSGSPETNGKRFAGTAVFGFNCITEAITYESRPGEVQVSPSMVGDKYAVDERVLEKLGLKVSEKVFL